MRIEAILLFLGFMIIGVPLLLLWKWLHRRIGGLLTGEQYLSREEVKKLRGKIENYEYISQDDFELWLKNDKPAFRLTTSKGYFKTEGYNGQQYKTYEEYMRMYNTPPEERARVEKGINDFLKSEEGKKFLDETGLFGKRQKA